MAVNTKQRMKQSLLVLTASLGLAAGASASMVTLNYSGSFSPDSSLGGTAFGVDTPFIIHATFDSTTDVIPASGHGIFPLTSLSIHLPSGTYAAASAFGWDAYVGDPRVFSGYAGGIRNAWLGMNAITLFTTATPAFSADAPTDSVLTGFSENWGAFPCTIGLDGGAGDLVVNDLGAGPFSASLTSSVPEPGQWAMMGLTLVGVACYGYRRFRANRAA